MTNDTIARYRDTMEPCCMSRLMDLIDEYRASHGNTSEAAFARQIGVSKQAVNAWRNRGLTEMPKLATLNKIAEVLNMPTEDLLYAVGVDTGLIIEHVVEVDDPIDLPRAARKGTPNLPH